MNKWVWRFALFLGLVLVVADQAFVSRAQADPKDACSIVSGSDVEAAFGEPFGMSQPESIASRPAQSSTCRFLSTNVPLKSVSVLLQHVSGDLSAGPMSDRLNKMHETNVQNVPGVGDDAAVGSMTLMGKTIIQMYVRKGKFTVITIMIGGFPDDANTANGVKTLAAKIVPKV